MKNVLFSTPTKTPQHNIAGNKIKEEKLSQPLKRQFRNRKEVIHSDIKYYINTLEG